MKLSLAVTHRTQTGFHSGERGNVRIVLLVVIVFALGLVAGAFLLHRAPPPPEAGTGAIHDISLSEATLSALKNLQSPVEIRFYSLLKDPDVSNKLGAFSGRVGSLLDAYEQAADGKVRIVLHSTPTDSEINAASADGITPFNRESGDACYLGLVVTENGQKESIPRLLPDWEPALESDLTRAILRVSQPKAVSPAISTAPEITDAVTAEVRTIIPNLSNVSLEDGKRMLREAAIKELTAAASEMSGKIVDAQHRFTQAVQNGASESEQQAAANELQELQTEQTQKLKDFAAKSQALIAAFEQMKSSAN